MFANIVFFIGGAFVGFAFSEQIGAWLATTKDKVEDTIDELEGKDPDNSD